MMMHSITNISIIIITFLFCYFWLNKLAFLEFMIMMTKVEKVEVVERMLIKGRDPVEGSTSRHMFLSQNMTEMEM